MRTHLYAATAAPRSCANAACSLPLAAAPRAADAAALRSAAAVLRPGCWRPVAACRAWATAWRQLSAGPSTTCARVCTYV